MLQTKVVWTLKIWQAKNNNYFILFLQVIMFNLQNLDCKIVIMSLCIVNVLMLCEGRPLR